MMLAGLKLVLVLVPQGTTRVSKPALYVGMLEECHPMATKLSSNCNSNPNRCLIVILNIRAHLPEGPRLCMQILQQHTGALENRRTVVH